MRSILRPGGAGLITAAVCVALAAGTASAATRSPLASLKHDVKAANAALTTLSHNAKHHAGAAKRALAHNEAAIAAASRELKALKGHTNVAGAGTALTLIAKQYGADARMFTALVPSASGSLQTQLANGIKPALVGQTIATGLLGELTKLLSAPGATSTSGTIGGLLGNIPSLIQSLTGMVNGGGYSTQIQAILSGALTTASGLLDAGINQVQGLLPTLPAPAQTAIQGVLGQIQSAFTTFECALTQAAQTITSALGGTTGSQLGGQLSQVLSLLQGFFGGAAGGSGSSTGTDTTSTGAGVTCPASSGTGSTGSTGSTGTGSTGTGSTGTGSTGTGLPFLGSLPIPSFVQSLLQNLLGGLGGSGAGGLFGPGGGLPFGLSADRG